MAYFKDEVMVVYIQQGPHKISPEAKDAVTVRRATGSQNPEYSLSYFRRNTKWPGMTLNSLLCGITKTGLLTFTKFWR